MDFLNQLAGQQGHNQQQTPQQQGGSGGGIMGFLNNAAGGGQAGEAKEDGLDKAVDWVQQHYLGAGDQSNESAAEQFKDEQISDAIRGQFKNITGRDFPIPDKS
ncbi:DNA damage-responsive-like protein [Ceratobasidium theobromae]|uniref:DNA damage-responsive-like protein n=1 Tax=Ceratobasidium theobromae TaxID=1582974 RepID=A0A5N5QCI7_9AGAM|nr:DNA damage-responsive-like protein [Ceratobasidium theobromae]